MLHWRYIGRVENKIQFRVSLGLRGLWEVSSFRGSGSDGWGYEVQG